jgi:hypothetical protein
MSTPIFQGLSFLEVVEKMQEDKSFSDVLEALALGAVVAGIDSPAGEMLLRVFAKNEEELAQLVANQEILKGVLTVNRRDTVEGTAPETPGIGTTPTTIPCGALGLGPEGFAHLVVAADKNEPEAPQK